MTFLPTAPSASILDTVGGTSVLRLDGWAPGGGEVFAKLELQNPSGSLADRLAVALVDRAEREGRWRRGGTLIEATLGNMGIALAQVGAARGARVIACMPEGMSLEKRAVLRLWGAEVVLTPADEHLAGARARALAVAREHPDALLMPQWDVETAAAAHEEGIGAELVTQIRADGGRIDAFVVPVGTGATLRGMGRALKAAFPDVQLIAVVPSRDGAHRLQGAATRREALPLAQAFADRMEAIEDSEAWTMRERLAREYGVLAGITSGAALAAAARVARERPGRHVYTVLWDTGERYFSLAERFR